MSRHNKKNHGNSNTIINNTEIDYDKLAEAIVSANNKLKEQEEYDKKKNSYANQKELNKIIGIKEYPITKNIFKHKLHEIRNNFSVLFHIIFFKEKNAKYDVVTFGLLQFATVSIFSICKYFLYLFTLVLLIMTFIVVSNEELIFNFQPVYFLYASLIFLFSRIFRVAEFEIKHITDRNYLIGILSATTCFFAMLVAIIALFTG